MFVIPCKYNKTHDYIHQLVDDIRRFHDEEEIVIVDSNSSDKSYFKLRDDYQNVIIEDVANENWMIGAYWHAFIKYDRPFYYFMHDSMRVKSNLDYLKDRDLTIMCWFRRELGNFNGWESRIVNESGYKQYSSTGCGCYGPIFFCKRKVMSKLYDKGMHKILPDNKQDTWYAERTYGFCFEEEGYDLKSCALFGDVLENEQETGKSGAYPFNTSWQFPIEKFYASHRAVSGDGRKS